MKGKGKTGMNYKGKGDKGKGDRQKCWNCANFGHFSKDCKMMMNAVDYVTDDTQEELTEEEWNDWLCSGTEEWYENQYYEDWTDWTDWTDWSDDWTGYWHEQNWLETQTVGHPTGSNDANLVSQSATQNLASGAQPREPAKHWLDFDQQEYCSKNFEVRYCRSTFGYCCSFEHAW